jgi:hypothetical protein
MSEGISYLRVYHNFTCAYRRPCPCARRRRVTVAAYSRLRDDHLHSFQSVRAIICGQPPSPRHKHIASHPPPLTPPSERTQHMAHEHLWGRRGAVVSACMQRQHMAHEHLHGLQRLHLDPLHLWGGRGAVVSACMQRLHLDPLHLWQSVAIRGNQRQSVAAISGPLAPRPVAPGAIWARLASDTLAVPWAQHW